MEKSHPDFDMLSKVHAGIVLRAGGESRLQIQVPLLIQDAIDFVVDPVRTARTTIADLDNVEKTFIGLKIEHFFRDFIDVPKGLRDLEIDGIDVDVKNTVGKSWTIPPETYLNSEPVVLVMVADAERHCSLGIFVARPEYMRAAANRDAKLGIRASAHENIWWLVERANLPDSRWVEIDMARFRQLRNLKGGNNRAAQFFRENIGKVIHRSILQALLFDQLDYMKRIRGNGGAKDTLAKEGIAILSGQFRAALIEHFGLPSISRNEFLSVNFSREDTAIMKSEGYFTKKA